MSICPSVFLFTDDNLSKCKWIFTKLGMSSDIVKIWFETANGQISSVFDRLVCLSHVSCGVLSFYIFILLFRFTSEDGIF